MTIVVIKTIIGYWLSLLSVKQNWDIGDNHTGTIHNKYNDNDDNENIILYFNNIT